jgi:hypothetical protein
MLPAIQLHIWSIKNGEFTFQICIGYPMLSICYYRPGRSFGRVESHSTKLKRIINRDRTNGKVFTLSNLLSIFEEIPLRLYVSLVRVFVTSRRRAFTAP